MKAVYADFLLLWGLVGAGSLSGPTQETRSCAALAARSSDSKEWPRATLGQAIASGG